MVSRGDAQAGHFFEYDEDALERLTGLTRELKLGVKREDGEGSMVDEDDGDAVEDEGDMFESANVDVDGGEDEGRRAVPWFEA